ncbi:hypothetical protein HUO09_04130 [Vibrio sp. Y2-5]|uniref:hypothetical protein n=1 Tax=Vibrio TaxID=662 RepID=UPI00142E6EC4|nr:MULTISPECIES: hypothetical protein [Vibrio]MBD0785515.1 hypothetical protein [Vibrio sp. Y2-5]NIY93052.1 hypothetical protein [Vibrio diazotrophicus]
MTKLAFASFAGLLLIHTAANAFTNDQFAVNDSSMQVASNEQYTTYKTNKTSGLDLSTVAASTLVGYLDENSDSNFLPSAAAAIAISAGLQYTVDTQVNAISDVKIAPYFSGSETGISLSFSFQ